MATQTLYLSPPPQTVTPTPLSLPPRSEPNYAAEYRRQLIDAADPAPNPHTELIVANAAASLERKPVSRRMLMTGYAAMISNAAVAPNPLAANAAVDSNPLAVIAANAAVAPNPLTANAAVAPNPFLQRFSELRAAIYATPPLPPPPDREIRGQAVAAVAAAVATKIKDYCVEFIAEIGQAAAAKIDDFCVEFIEKDEAIERLRKQEDETFEKNVEFRYLTKPRRAM